MSSSWTQVRRLPVRRVLSAIRPGYTSLRNTLWAVCYGSLAVVLVLRLLPDAAALADRVPHDEAGQESVAPVNPVDVFNALSRCQAPLSVDDRWRLAGAIHDESHRHGYDPLFVMAMIEVESGCSPTARGERGGVGLVQMKPSTARAVAKEAGLPWHGAEALVRPVENVQLALLYLSRLEERFGDPYLAMVAFNRGPARVGHMSPQRARGARYVKKVLARYEDLSDEAATATSDDEL
jgi:soluble lytic murein transglycosylase-like protein